MANGAEELVALDGATVARNDAPVAKADGDALAETIREGDAAFERQDYARARDLWTLASARDPANVALARKLAHARANLMTHVATPNPCPPAWRAGDPLPSPPTREEALAPPAYPAGVMEEETRPGPPPDDLLTTLGHQGGHVLSSLMHGLTALAGTSLHDGTWTSWYRAPGPIPGDSWVAQQARSFWRVLKLAAMRENLNGANLFSAYPPGARTRFLPRAIDRPPNHLTVRTIDGTWNDLDDPGMGSAGARFGANVARRTTDEPLLAPNPRDISRELLTRDTFKPVPFLNLLAAAWIQFQVHDWFSHGENDPAGTIDVPLAENDPLRATYGLKTLRIPRSAADPTRRSNEVDVPPSHRNEVTHWWDGSQIYGSDYATADRLRAFAGGRLRVDDRGFLPLDDRGVDDTGFKRNWWIGLSLLHHLFVHEHNAIAAMLETAHPGWSDQRLYDTARMINAAVMAKIHTVEWTPAILPNAVLAAAMDANWYGFFGGHKRTVTAINFDNPEAFGIVGNSRNLHGVPYSLSQEFVAVYRMHSLLPDSVGVRTLDGGDVVEELPLAELRQAAARGVCERHGMTNLLYSFGVAHPGALVLNNFPGALQSLSIPGFPVLDMGAVDVIRDRERGVPRYNEFRRQLQLRPLRSFDEITDDAEVVEKLRRVYDDDIESLDLLIGCLAEGHRPEHFGFGETAFQVFILNASRRLQADRFYTTHYNETVYTAEGLEWIDAATMKSVLLRHHPELARTGLADVDNAFAPWEPTGVARTATAEQIVSDWSEEWGLALSPIPDDERPEHAARHAEAICALQRDLEDPDQGVGRTLHRKGVFASDARFTVDPTLPAALRYGAFDTPGRTLRAVVRFSNASGRAEADSSIDLRGLAVRLTDGDHVQDLLATNFPTSHAKDTDAFIASTGLARGVARGLAGLLAGSAPWEAIAMLSALTTARRPCATLAGETFWSRAQFQLGRKLVEFRWVPTAPATPHRRGRSEHELTYDMIDRVRNGTLRWQLEVRGYVDTALTPLDDGRKAWSGRWVRVGVLELPRHEHLSAEEAQRAIERTQELGFSIAKRWRSDDACMRGRGLLNEFREEIYAASQAGRGANDVEAGACPYLAPRRT